MIKMYCAFKTAPSMILNRYERTIYCSLWIGGVLYSVYNVFLVRKEFVHFDDKYNDFKEGWFLQMPKKDVADVEWESVIKVLKNTFHFFVIHVMVSEYLRSYYVQVVPYWQSLISTIFIQHNVGWIGVILIVFQPVLFNYMSLGRRKYVPWVLTGFCLIVVMYLKSAHFAKYQAKHLNLTEVQTYILMVSLCWVNLRCLSYCLDDVHEKYRFIHFLSYCLYLPTLFVGPFIQFKDFNKNFNYNQHQGLKQRFLQLAMDILRYGWWIFVTELSLHYFYINALSYQTKLVQGMNNWTLYGYGYCMGQFFHLKYIVFYGLSTSIAKFEHIRTPALPKCIARIHLYSDMWKYFDVGLYKFLVTYIYLPTLHTCQFYNKLFSSLLCFSFVYVWHGIEYHIFVWTAINYIGVCLENIFREVTKLTPIVFSNSWRHRLSCLICSPLLAASAVSNFYFFAGSDVGNIFVQRIFESSMQSNGILIFCLYCCCHLSLEVKNREHTKKVK